MNKNIPLIYRNEGVAVAPRSTTKIYGDTSVPQPSVSDPLMHFSRLTVLPLLLKALSKAMVEWPLFRSSVSSEDPASPAVAIRPHCDISIALSTPTGLYTPTLLAVDSKSPYEVMGELRRLQALGRSIPHALSPKEMPKRGGTITVSNIGAVGNGEWAAPLLVPGGGVAIVAIGRAKWVEREGRKVYQVGVSWSADHRVVEGAELAEFVECWRSWVEEPARLLADGR